MAVPYTFGNRSAAQGVALSELDDDFAYLDNKITGLSGSLGHADTVAAFENTYFEAGIHAVEILGYYTIGEGTLSVRRTVGEPTIPWKFRSLDRFLPDESEDSATGGWWEGFTTDEELDASSVGVYADGTHDDTAAMQNANDLQSYDAVASAVSAPIGTIRITDTIDLGHGNQTITSRLYGAGETTITGGTLIDATSIPDQCAIALQGQRFGKLGSLTLLGANYDYVTAFALASTHGAAVDDTVVANWWNPALPINGSSSTAPHAGAAVDPYAGSTPTPAYPGKTYGKNFYSSNIQITDMIFKGFYVGMVTQPSGADAQGEFVSLTGGRHLNFVYGIGISQFNARQSFVSNVNFQNGFCAINTNYFGAGHGHSASVIEKCDLVNVIKWCDLYSTATSGIYSFRDCYCESAWYFGDCQGDMAVNWDNCQFNFDLHGFRSVAGPYDGLSPTRGAPLEMIGGGDISMGVNWTGGALRNFHSVAVVNSIANGVQIKGTNILPIDNWSRLYKYQQDASDALMGGLMFAEGQNSDCDGVRPRFGSYAAGYQIVGSYWKGKRLYPTPLWVSKHTGYDSSPGHYNYKTQATPLNVPDRRSPVVLANVTSITTVMTAQGIILTLVFNSASNIDPIYGPDAGDVLLLPSNHVFFVRSKNGRTVTAQLQNDFYAGANGQWTSREPFDFSSIICLCARFYTPGETCVGDFTATSPNVTNVKAGVLTVTPDVQIDDYYVSVAGASPLFAVGTYPKVLSVGSGALGFDTNAATSQTAYPLNTFCKPGPTIETAAFDPLVTGAIVWLDPQDIYSMWPNRGSSPAATLNLAVYSNALDSWSTFAGAGWYLVDGITLEQDQTGPNGQLNYAWRQTNTSGSASHWNLYAWTVAPGTYTHQFKAKKSVGDYLLCGVNIDAPIDAIAPVVFDINAGSVVSTAAGYSATITADAGGYWLCTVTGPIKVPGWFAFIASTTPTARSDLVTPWVDAGAEVILCEYALNAGAVAQTYEQTGQFQGYLAASVNGPVGAIRNKGVLGGVCLAPSDAQRPYLRFDAGKSAYYLDFTVNSGNAYFALPSSVTPTAYTMEVAAWQRQSAGIELVCFGASASATPYGARWAANNHIEMAFGNTAYDSGANTSTGYQLLTAYRDNTNTEYLRRNKSSIGSGAGSGTFSNNLDRVGIINGSNNAAYLYGAALMTTDDNSANITALETYFGAIIGV